MNENTFWIVVPSLLVGLLSWIVTNLRWMRVAALEAQVHKALIEKIASEEQFQAYLTSANGSRLLSGGLGGELPQRILNSVQAGIVLTVEGVALAVCSLIEPRIPLGISLLVGALGVGLLCAAATTRYLSKTWGLPDQPRSGHSQPHAG